MFCYNNIRQIAKQQSNITGLIVIPDNDLESTNTLNGKVHFVEFIGVTNDRLLAIKNKNSSVLEVYKQLDSDITDYNRSSVR